MFIQVIQSVVVYGLLIWIMTYYGNLAYKSQYPYGIHCNEYNRSRIRRGSFKMITSSYVLIPVFIFCLLAALRYRVGVDCESYKLIFHDIVDYGESYRAPNIEDGFKRLIMLTSVFTPHHYLLFFCLAFMQIICYYLAFNRERYVLLFLFIAIFLTGHYWSLMNGMRQNVAACMFVALIPLICQKKWLYCIIATILAMSIHRSAFLLFPLGIIAYFLQNKILNKYLQLFILILCFALMNKLDDVLSFDVFNYAIQAGYSSIEIDTYLNLEATEYSFGFRMIIQYIVYVCAIIYSDKMEKAFNSKLLNVMYNLFFVGICLTLLFYNNFTIKRLIYYMSCFNPVIISYLLFYLWKTKKSLIFAAVILLLSLQLGWSIYSDITYNGVMESMLYKFDL